MEKFRRPFRSSDVGSRGGAGRGGDRGPPHAPSPGGSMFQSHGAGGRGMASVSPTLSQASSALLTPQQPQQQPQAGGFSMFGGKAHSTPASSINSSGGGGSRTDQRSPLALYTSTNNTSTAAAVTAVAATRFPARRPRGGGGGGGGLPRFKTLAQTLREQEEEEEEEDEEEGKVEGNEESSRRHGRGSGVGTYRPTVAGRGAASPPPPSLSPSQSLLSPPTPRNGSLSSALSGGGGARHSFATPSPAAAPSRFAAGGSQPSTAPTRKRSRPDASSTPASTAPWSASPPPPPRQQLTPTVVSSSAGRARTGGGGSGGSGIPVARTWGSLAGGGRGARGQRPASPRPTVRAGGGLSGTPGGKSRAPRPAKSPRGRGGGARASSPRSQQQQQQQQQQGQPKPRRYTLADFAGADDVLYNPGASTEGLAIFLERCRASGTLALTLLWADLTTSFSATTVKSCLPSQSCYRWNCACGRQPRAQQAGAPIIGAVVYLPANAELVREEGASSVGVGRREEGVDLPDAETYLLPLAACQGEEEEEAAEEGGGYQLPLACQAGYDERWGALAKILAMPTKKVIFNAQVALMPFIAWRRRRRPGSGAFATPAAGGGGGGAAAEDSGQRGGASDGPRGENQRPTVSGLFDPRVAAWMSDTSGTDKALEFEALCISWLKDDAESSGGAGARSGGNGPTAAAAGAGAAAIVAAVLRAEECCKRSLALAAKLSTELVKAKMLAACEQVEMPAIPVLAGMEVSGVVFLPERLTRFSAALEQRLEGLRRTAVAAVGGRDFNLASPDQVAVVLFKNLKLPSPPVKAGSVHASTSAEVLAGLRGKHPVVAPILEFRGVNKYKTTYIDKLAERAVDAAAADSAVPASQAVGAGAVRIHAAWNQTSARTGRLSCSRPNLQQIPKSSDPLAGVEGVNVRNAFAASKTFTLMAADYSQIEMRVLAHACRDPGLMNLFTSAGGSGGGGGAGDVYRKLAAQVFGKEQGGITDAERTRAKVACLGIIYGMGTPQVAKNLEITESQAQGLVRSFLKAFPGIEPFLASTRRFARERGYVCTLTGRRRHLPDINNSRNATARAQAERQAVNSVVQGTAADIVKTAMVLVARRLDAWRSTLEEGLDCPRLIMQIHDELVLECPACEEDLERLKGLLTGCMEVEAPAMLGIDCPLTVNMLVGMSWGSMREVVCRDEEEDDESDDCE